MEYSIIQMELL